MTNSSNSSKARKFQIRGGVDKVVDSIATTLFGNTKAVNVNRIFTNKYNEEEANIIRSSLGYESVFSKPTGDVKAVSVSKIHPTQEYVGAENLKNISRAKIDKNDIPMAILKEGEVYIIDGHHRVAINILNGEKKIKVRLRKN